MNILDSEWSGSGSGMSPMRGHRLVFLHKIPSLKVLTSPTIGTRQFIGGTSPAIGKRSTQEEIQMVLVVQYTTETGMSFCSLGHFGPMNIVTNNKMKTKFTYSKPLYDNTWKVFCPDTLICRKWVQIHDMPPRKITARTYFDFSLCLLL